MPIASLRATLGHAGAVAVATILFYASSVLAGVMNKQLIDSAQGGPVVHPTVLTLAHLMFAAVASFICARLAGAGKIPDSYTAIGWFAHIAKQFLPIALTICAGKLATYASYEYVSMSLTHTAKAMEPIFNVLIAGAVFGQWKPWRTYLTLVPIAVGVALASSSELTYNHIGFLLAASSAMFKVYQNIYTKRIMQGEHFHFFEVHLNCAVSSLVVMLPLQALQLIASPDRAWAMPAMPLLLCSAVQWVASVSSYLVLALVAHLTFTILNSLKRLVIIVSGMLVFGIFTGTTFVGVCIAVAGILGYSLQKEGKHKASSPGAQDSAVQDNASQAATDARPGTLDGELAPSSGARMLTPRSKADWIAAGTSPVLAGTPSHPALALPKHALDTPDGFAHHREGMGTPSTLSHV